MNLIQVETQADFPTKDISDAAAAMLELLLLNRELVNAYHNSAEMVSFLYRLGHKTLALAANPQFNDSGRLAAFSYGIGAFEAISTIVHPWHNEYPDEQTTTLHVMATNDALAHAFVGTLMDARDRFREELPRTTRVIGESAAHFYRDHTDYALSGAAIARELEVQTTAA